MNLDELQSVRDRERQTDKLQQLRESFYKEAGEFIRQLQAERDRAAERADDPFDDPEVQQLTDEINTAEQTVEAIYEKRIGKIVKAASLDAAGLPSEADGLTAEEQDLFETLVADIKHHRSNVLDVLEGEEPTSRSSDSAGVDSHTDSTPPADHDGQHSSESLSDRDSHAGEASGATASGSEDERPVPPDVSPDSESGTDVSVADAMGGADTSEPDHDDSRGERGSQDQRGKKEDATRRGTGKSTSQQVSDGGDSSGRPASPESRERTEHTDQGGKLQVLEQPLREDGGQTQPKPTQSSSHAATPPASAETTGAATAEATTTQDQKQDGETAVTNGAGAASTDAIQRETVLITEDVETFVGFDDRDYDLGANDVVTLPETNASLLVERNVAKQLR